MNIAAFDRLVVVQNLTREDDLLVLDSMALELRDLLLDGENLHEQKGHPVSKNVSLTTTCTGKDAENDVQYQWVGRPPGSCHRRAL